MKHLREMMFILRTADNRDPEEVLEDMRHEIKRANESEVLEFFDQVEKNRTRWLEKHNIGEGDRREPHPTTKRGWAALLTREMGKISSGAVFEDPDLFYESLIRLATYALLACEYREDNS